MKVWIYGEQVDFADINANFEGAILSLLASETDSGSSGAYEIVPEFVVSAYADRQVFGCIAASDSVDGQTFSVSGLTAHAIKTNYNQAILPGAIKSGMSFVVMYDATNTCFQLLTPVISLTSKNETLKLNSLFHIPVLLGYGNVQLTKALFSGSVYRDQPAQYYIDLGTSTSNRFSIRTDSLEMDGSSAGDDGILQDQSSGVSLDDNWIAEFKFRIVTAPGSSDKFFIGFTPSADSLDATSNPPGTGEKYCGLGFDGTNWYVGNSNGAGTQTKTTLTALTAGYYLFRMERSGSNLIYRLNSAASQAQITHTATLPSSGSLNFYATGQNGSSAASRYEVFKSIDLYIPV